MSQPRGADTNAARDRYGRRVPRPDGAGGNAASKGTSNDRGLRIAFVVFLVLLVSGTVWIGLDKANPDVRASIPTFKVTSDHSVEARIEVVKDKDKSAVCVLRSRSSDGSEVGRKEVRIPASDARTVVVTEVLQTTARPNTAELDGCRIS
ncbi:DUF4307 domain-containing protein [Yinghuangia seranimata]|uniref:DUF4307 domain-containing protein n=1 Tax=Yinghuangia seranimata TaxID=408067 RepID=UPI00248AC4E9|nr:DUF4307 domain-containing protein [Yinghuangia seranimata]MDI2128833.1 DUF4307 domain-containing protein [Yinghuangia seranimata]